MYKNININEFQGTRITFTIWDKASEERNLYLSKLFYKDAKIAILVYDITREESFEKIKKFWYNEIKEYAQ